MIQKNLMIADQCFTIEWQTSKREELGGCDPVLLEKTIHAFALLDALAVRGLEFVFKGGTSLLLRLPRIQRLSIDVDIFCQEPAEKLDRLLAEISKIPPFAQVGFAVAPKDGRDELLDAGRKQIGSHLVGVKFRREEMKIAAAKAALLTSALRAAAPPAIGTLRYDETKLASLKDLKFDAAFSAASKLKAVPEAMWLWSEALRLHGTNT